MNDASVEQSSIRPEDILRTSLVQLRHGIPKLFREIIYDFPSVIQPFSSSDFVWRNWLWMQCNGVLDGPNSRALSSLRTMRNEEVVTMQACKLRMNLMRLVNKFFS